MDPDTALADARDALGRMRHARDQEDYNRAANDLAARFGALDDWLRSGGFLPARWADYGRAEIKRT